MKKAKMDWPALAAAVGVVLVVEAIGTAVTSWSDWTWYRGLDKPSWTPPGWVFGTVWTLLYLSMAAAAWLVLRERDRQAVVVPLGVFAGQLLLNAVWTPLFFGLHSPFAALIDLTLLWPTLAAAIVLFWRIVPLAGGILLPYLAWVSFAWVLNLGTWYMNR